MYTCPVSLFFDADQMCLARFCLANCAAGAYVRGMSQIVPLLSSHELPWWRRPVTLLFLMAFSMPIAFFAWYALLNNFVIEAAGFDGIGFTDHPAPTHRWLEAGGHDALDPFGLEGVPEIASQTLLEASAGALGFGRQLAREANHRVNGF